MKDKIRQFHRLYCQVSKYLDWRPERYIQGEYENRLKILNRYQKYSEHLAELLYLCLPQLSLLEIIGMYEDGCYVLQENLSGYMANHFDPQYIPLMIRAIEQQHGHTAWIFIEVLRRHIDKKEMAPILIQMLKTKYMIVEALNYARLLQVTEVIPVLEATLKTGIPDTVINSTNSTRQQIEELTQQTLQSLVQIRDNKTS